MNYYQLVLFPFVVCNIILVLATFANASSLFHSIQQQQDGDVGFDPVFPDPKPSTVNTTVRWETQNLDHFGWRNDTYQQRWFVYDKFYKQGGPCFFVTGNEVSAALLVNWTATAWRMGKKFNGLVVFAEHRFYGESIPCPGSFQQCGDFLSMEQAMQDYIHLIFKIRTVYYPGVGATVVYGGSYGSIIASSMRLKFPSIVQGAIASSGPVGNWNETFRPSSYWQVVSNTMETMTPGCKTATSKALLTAQRMLEKGGSEAQIVSRIFGFCSVPSVYDFSVWTRAQFDAAAMGNYPFSTYYILGTFDHPSPPLPVKVMCDKIVPQAGTDIAMLEQVAAAMAVVANITKDQKCFDVQNVGKSVSSPVWSFMQCSSWVMNELPMYGSDGLPNDAFIPTAGFTHADYNSWCAAKFNKTPRFNHFRDHGLTAAAYTASGSNIIATATLFGGWSAGNLGRASEGYFYNISSSVTTFVCDDCGHHEDLMWETPHDGANVQWIRMRQTQQVERWISEYNK